MDSNQVLNALRREKVLLEKMLELAECQLELIQSGRVDDIEIVLSLRAESMSELADTEVSLGGEIPQLDPGLNLSRQELAELNKLNLLIITLANQIADIDDRGNELADIFDSFLSHSSSPSSAPAIECASDPQH